MGVYAVTGGAGFIGSNIVEELLRRNQTVKVIDNFSTGKRENIKAFKDGIEIIDADLATAPNLSQILNGVEYVIHEAAIPSIQ
jgi:UDP-N-acetylglucosamine/UDP-N-acetyl-alpha-D-glucosaminouronate 4-epimerase